MFKLYFQRIYGVHKKISSVLGFGSFLPDVVDKEISFIQPRLLCVLGIK
jgi:hypothetical protein